MLEFLFVFFLVIIFFVCTFSIIVFFVFTIIHKLRHTNSKISLKSLIIKLSLFLFPIYIVLFVAGGCSYQYIDPQYYEFKRLCEKTFIVYDEKLFQEVKILINKKVTLIRDIEEGLNNDKKIQELYLEYKKEILKNKDRQISEWEEIEMRRAFIRKYVNDNFEYLNTLSNGKKWKIDFLGRLNEFDFYKAKKYDRIFDGQALYYFDDKNQIVLIAETRLYEYLIPSYQLRLPSDAGPGGFVQNFDYCGSRTFNWR